MAGVTQYTDEEIRFILHAIVTKQTGSLKEQYELRFRKPLGSNQVRYIKNKYGRDPRYGSVMVNYRGTNAADLAPGYSALSNAGSSLNNPVDLTTSAPMTTATTVNPTTIVATDHAYTTNTQQDRFFSVPASTIAADNGYAANTQQNRFPSAPARAFTESPALSNGTPAAAPYPYMTGAMPQPDYFPPTTGYSPMRLMQPPMRPSRQIRFGQRPPMGFVSYAGTQYHGFGQPGVYMNGFQQPIQGQQSLYGLQENVATGINVGAGPPMLFAGYGGPVPSPVTPTAPSFSGTPEIFRGEELVPLSRDFLNFESVELAKENDEEEHIIESIEHPDTGLAPTRDPSPEPEHPSQNSGQFIAEDLLNVDALIEEELFGGPVAHHDQIEQDDPEHVSLAAFETRDHDQSNHRGTGAAFVNSYEPFEPSDLSDSTVSDVLPESVQAHEQVEPADMHTAETAQQTSPDLETQDAHTLFIPGFDPSVDFDHQLHPDPNWNAGLVTSHDELVSMLVYD